MKTKRSVIQRWCNETFTHTHTGCLPGAFVPTQPRKLISWQPLQTPRLKVSVLEINALNCFLRVSWNSKLAAQPFAEPSTSRIKPEYLSVNHRIYVYKHMPLNYHSASILTQYVCIHNCRHKFTGQKYVSFHS